MDVFLLIAILALLLSSSVQAASFPCTSATYVDSYSSLPSAPVYPTATLSSSLNPVISNSNPLTQNHWSETANLAAYRPPLITLSSNPSRTNCPYLQAGLKNWHDPATWGGSIPSNNSIVNIPPNTSVLISSCSINPDFIFKTINIPASSKLIIGDAVINIKATGFNVAGSLLAGSQTCRLRNKVSITLHGSRTAQSLPAADSVKGIAVSGIIDLHGARFYPTWTRLAVTAQPGSSYIFVQDRVNWQAGQRIVITSTELKDTRDWHRNEERTIVAVRKTTISTNVTAIQLNQPLNYLHFGGREYQAEVSLLSRNILVQGDTNSLPTDAVDVCQDPDSDSTHPCQDKWLTGFGAHIIVYGNTAQGRFSGVELFRVGQTNVLGRYPIHFHMMGNRTASNYQNAYVSDSAVHDSYFRCFAIHGTQGVRLTENTAYNAIGHCYFLEDGVEENNIISYNQAALIHPLGPFVDATRNSWDWWAQFLSYFSATDTLILPSDMSASCFYITNAYNDVIGNAASGGWAGYALPILPSPVKLHSNITLKPANRPFRTPFRGNSAHSTGYWWLSAGGIYVGGELYEDSNGLLHYTAGRNWIDHDTCGDPLVGTVVRPNNCYPADYLWLRFEDNKVFLSNRGMQHWGNRAEIIKLELHDVSLAMNIFGKVWIDKMLMECRTRNHRITWFHGCPSAPPEIPDPNWARCNLRDSSYFEYFNGFQWYDVNQQHILTNSTFRNCRSDWERCVYTDNTGICRNTAAFTSLTHSDSMVPDLMQGTSGIKYENVSDLWRFSTKKTDSTGITVAGRLHNWFDADGSTSLTGNRSMIGSTWANDWWKYNNQCTIYKETYVCKMAASDSAASMLLLLGTAQEGQVNGDICTNGGGQPCPIIGYASHFGSINQTAGLHIAVHAKLTGPLIGSSGGWFIRLINGNPRVLTITSIQVANMNDVLLLAFPYPAGTTFSIYYKAAYWCHESWAVCRHNFFPVNSIAAVRNAFGDAYYWNSATRTLYLRAVMCNETFATDAPWTPHPPELSFIRGGISLHSPVGAVSLIIEASCATDPCAHQNNVPIPAAFNSSSTSTSTATTSTTAKTTSTTTASSTTGSGSTPAPVVTQKLYATTLTPSIIYSDTQSVNLGLRFTTAVAGQVKGVQVYRAANIAISSATLYNFATQASITTVTFSPSSSSSSAWVEVLFASPVNIPANTAYIISCFFPVGQYASVNNGFDTARTVGNIIAPVGAGVYSYSSSASFPSSSYLNSEYFVSPLFVAA